MLFTRDKKTNSQLGNIMKASGWLILGYNAVTLTPYFYKVLSGGNWIQQIFGSSSAVVLILGIEAAAMTVMFDPNALLQTMERPRALLGSHDPLLKNFSAAASIAGVIAFCLVAGYVFWFDYNVNLAQMGAKGNTAGLPQFIQILATVFVLGSEIAFGCANIFNHAEVQDARKV
jgi:hypothetical protein